MNREPTTRYVIDGQKMWLTNGGSSNLVAVLVKTDEGADSVYRNLTTFLVEKETGFGETAQGVTIPGKIDKMGYKGVDTTEMVFEGHRISADQILGGEPGKGFYQMMDGVEVGRVNVAARATGVANRAFELAIAYAQQRETFGKKIAEHQAILFRLAEMATKVETSHAMLVRAARMKDSGERNDVESGHGEVPRRGVLQRGGRGLVPDPRRLRVLQGVRDRAPLPRGGVPADRRGHRRHPEDDHRPGVAEGLQAQGLTSAVVAAGWPCVRTSASWVVEQGAPASGCRDPRHRGLQKRLEYFSTAVGNARIPGPGVSVVGARIPCMATVFDDLTRHPVAAAVAAAEDDLDQVTGVGFWSMSRTETAETLAALHRLQARVAALELGILHRAEVHELGTEVGAADTASWWANTDPADQDGTPSAAWSSRTPLDHDHEPVRDAMAAGRCPRNRRW